MVTSQSRCSTANDWQSGQSMHSPSMTQDLPPNPGPEKSTLHRQRSHISSVHRAHLLRETGHCFQNLPMAAGLAPLWKFPVMNKLERDNVPYLQPEFLIQVLHATWLKWSMCGLESKVSIVRLSDEAGRRYMGMTGWLLKLATEGS